MKACREGKGLNRVREFIPKVGKKRNERVKVSSDFGRLRPKSHLLYGEDTAAVRPLN